MFINKILTLRNLFIVAMVLYVETYFFNEIKVGVVFVDITSPFRRVLDPSGKTDRFTISGVISEVLAHISILINVILIIQNAFFESCLDISVFNMSWDILAMAVSDFGVTIETIINCKKMKKGIGKIGTVIIIAIMIVAGFFFFFVGVAGIIFYLCGLQWTSNGLQWS